ncbi:RNA-directed DNA polymerase [Bradyrhizobium vignae]|uniref:RNA-directed DNA polymerase n=1 Tax=Bradyrhizobium vignae TaxID=1549949 RepID=UPI0011AE68E6|nr:RNA-directed DNA polymerase [Bradyrhizobium vignae]
MTDSARARSNAQSSASRIIAESVLADSDNALADEQIEFTRFVDDYRIFVKHGQAPYSILAFLADQLAASEGLSLNAQKTKLYSIEKFKEHIDAQLGDAFDDAEREAIEALSHAFYFDENVVPRSQFASAPNHPNSKNDRNYRPRINGKGQRTPDCIDSLNAFSGHAGRPESYFKFWGRTHHGVLHLSTMEPSESVEVWRHGFGIGATHRADLST